MQAPRRRLGGLRSDRGLGWLAVLAGSALAFAVQVAAPVGVPLYDGVHFEEPYRYLHPSGDEAGMPTSFTATPAVVEGASPAIAAATTESPPQAQLIAQKGAFELATDTVSLRVAITPVEAPAPPSGWAIAGNVYRFEVTDQAGAALEIRTCDGCVSLALRGPDEHGEAEIKRYVDGAWVDVESVHAAMTGLFQVNPTALGDYAVLEVVDQEPGPDPVLLVGGGLLAALLAGMAFLLFRVRPATTAPGQAPAGPGGPPAPPEGERRRPPDAPRG